jgi:hypothetical protein
MLRVVDRRRTLGEVASAAGRKAQADMEKMLDPGRVAQVTPGAPGSYAT